MEKCYITTAIDYVNGKPHIGHAYEKILTDILARYKRMDGKAVYFLTGTDEHGIKIEKTAQKRGISPRELCDENAAAFKENWKELGINYDKFIRTTDEEHEKAVQKIFQKLIDNGDIYKHAYRGIYCSGCETFLNERELDENGNCPIHGSKPEEIQEENYFFNLKRYKSKIEEIIKSDETNFIRPNFKRSEVLNQLEEMEDFSVSRAKSSVTWGVEVPNDREQIIYVWVDALSNYITAIGYDPENSREDFKVLWGEDGADIQVIGKDILKFHAIYWIAILLSLGIALPKNLLAHGWITIDETKMSKSVGNVIASTEIMKEFELKDADAVRYYMATAAAIGKDGNYSDGDFKERVNSNLANNIGNLLNRTLNMLVKYFDGEIKSEYKSEDLKSDCEEALKLYKGNFERFEVAEAAQNIINLADKANKYVTDSAPWTLAKEERMGECGRILYNVLETMRYIAIMLAPYCPNIAQNIWQQIKEDGDVTEFKFDALRYGGIKDGKLIERDGISPVFLRIDSEFAEDKKKRG